MAQPGGERADGDSSVAGSAQDAAGCGDACDTHEGGGPDGADAQVRQPRVASSGPYRMHTLVPDEDTGAVPECDCGRRHIVYGKKYRFCTCGLSKTQPWCDNSHVGTRFKPTPFVADKKQTWYLMCVCKRTKDPKGHCDGSHAFLTMDDFQW